MALLTPTFYTAKSAISGTTLVSDTEIPAMCPEEKPKEKAKK